VTPDETGWKVGGRLWWMWAFSSDKLTVYSIQPGCGCEQASFILGDDFDGFLVRDGWAVYRRFTQAVHQTCVAHLLRRCREMLEVSRPGEAKLPRTVKEILKASLKRVRLANYMVDGGAIGMREVFRRVFLPPRMWA